MSDISKNRNVCPKCLRSKQFSAWIDEQGQPGTCDFDKSHRSRRQVVTVGSLSQEFDTYFREIFRRGAMTESPVEGSDNMSYEEAGDSYKQILSDSLLCDEIIVQAISLELEKTNDRDEKFYDEMANYEPIIPPDEVEYERAPVGLDEAY